MLVGLVLLKNIDSTNKIYLNLLNSNKEINLYYHLIGTNIIYNKKVKLEIENVDLILQHFNIDFVVVKINKKYIYEINDFINKIKIAKVIHCFTDVSLELTNDSVNYLRLHNNCKMSYIYETLQIKSKVTVSNTIDVNRLTPPNIFKAPNISKELSNFSEICMSFLECLEDVQNKQISKNSIYESVYIEFRELKHSEFIIKNCIIKLNEKWSHTVICCNDNYDFTVNFCNKINKNINIIKLDITNATYNDYNNLLFTKNFWNNLKGMKILIYQSDSVIFNMNVDDFLQYDYIGTPFTSKCILAKSQVGNGGLSLRSKNVMLDVLNNPKCDRIYSRIAENFRLTNKLDRIPEDIYFSQNIQNLKLGLVPDEEVGKKFGFLNKYENTFGMHAIWRLCGPWKDIIKNHMKNNLVDKNNSNFKINTNETIKVVDSLKSEDIIKISEQNCQIKWENVTNSSGYLREDNVNYTRQIGTSETDFLQKCDAINIDLITECIFIVDFFNGGGGTTTFINLIISKYKYYNNFLVIRKMKKKIYLTLNDDYLIKTFENETDVFAFIANINVTKIFVNHLLGYSFSFLNNLYSYKCIKNIKLVTITHDYYMFLNKIQPTYEEINKGDIKPNKEINLDFFDEIITQDECNLKFINGYTKDKTKMRVISLPDYYKREKFVKFVNKKFTVGIIGNIHNHKGEKQLRFLIESMPNINFVVFGMFNYKKVNLFCYSYNGINELNELLVKYNPNVLLELSIWPETYCYTLTLSLLTNLPLIILDKLDESVIINRTKKISSSFMVAKNLKEIENYINKLSAKIEPTSFYTIFPRIHFSEDWNEMFISGYNKHVKMEPQSVYKKDLLKYVIYFPQFYSFNVNNRLFYEDYTDIKNLNILLEKDYLNEILTPNFMNFNMTNLTDYDILNNDYIMNNQFKLLDDYNLDGLACYYYWFSINSLDNDHMIMRESVDKLFKTAEKYNKNIYFIWANEDWTRNLAMGSTNSSDTIINKYLIGEFKDNFNNMLPYFRSSKYLKYNNKPVLMIYHSFLFPTQYIKIFEDTFNVLCLENGFSGINIYWNVMKSLDTLDKDYDYNKFYMNFNYKINNGFRYVKDLQAVIDYEKYLIFCNNNIKNDIVQTLVFDFDNNARLVKPERRNMSTLCINNYHFLKIQFINMILNKYSKKDDNNIIMINSLNEWGEKMSIEPSNEIGFYYLNLLENYLK